jgi:glycosyltransferase involved in cell wall biosynthesis
MKNDYPKITIITPSYNQGEFIGETIASVLDQGYPNLEYILIDNCSTDNTRQTVSRFGNKIIWISEPDKGQADAVNKGIRLASGEIIAFLNSDDFYLPGVLFKIADEFIRNPDIDWITGDYLIVDEDGKKIQSIIVRYKYFFRSFFNSHTLRWMNYIAQPSTFWRKRVTDQIGGLDSSLRFAFDYDLWMRMADRFPCLCLSEPISAFRLYKQSKSGNEYHSQFDEELAVLKRYHCSRLEYLFHKIHNMLILIIYDLIK